MFYFVYKIEICITSNQKHETKTKQCKQLHKKKHHNNIYKVIRNWLVIVLRKNAAVKIINILHFGIPYMYAYYANI